MSSSPAEVLLGLLGHEATQPCHLREIGTLLEGARLARFSCDEGDYVGHVAAACRSAFPAGSVTTRELLDALRDLALDDLALAYACARGDRFALAELEREMIEAVPKALVRLRPDARLVDDVRQELRLKLLVADEQGRPKILEYKGRGPLAAWVRVVALRIAYTRLRAGAKDSAHEDAAALEALADSTDAPDVAHLKAKYAIEVREAFQEAVARLPPEVRAVLRAHAHNGLSIDQIGALYQVHRATAARWVQHAKSTLRDALREALERRIGVDRDACESIVALVWSRIDLSMDRVLSDEDAPAPLSPRS